MINFDLLLRLFLHPSLNMSPPDGVIPPLAPGHTVEHQETASPVCRNLVYSQPLAPPPTCRLPAIPLCPQRSYDHRSRHQDMLTTSPSTLRACGTHDRQEIPSSPSSVSLTRTICVQPSLDSLLHAVMHETEAQMSVYLPFRPLNTNFFCFLYQECNWISNGQARALALDA